MQLLLLVLNQTDLLDSLLKSFMENSIHGATILSSTGMAYKLSKHEDYPIFGTLRTLLNLNQEENKTIFMVLKDEEVPKVKSIIRSVIGDLSKPNTAVMFTLPVIDTEGLITK